MNNVTFFPWLVVAPVGIALVMLLVFGWRREMKRRRAEIARRERIIAAKIPDEAAFVVTEQAPLHIGTSLIGSYELVGIGTYGVHQVQRLLVLLEQCGLERMVGSILIVEHDAENRNQFHHQIPPCYFERIVYGYSEQYSGGMGSLPIEKVLEHIAVWGMPIVRASREVIDLHLRRNGNRTPSIVFVFASLGGHAPLGLPVLDVLQERFQEALFVGLSALPKHTRQRERYYTLKGAYEKRGVHGWVLSDNLATDVVTADYGLVAMLVGLSDAALHSSQSSTQVNNVLRLALTQEPGAILIYQVVTDSVVAERFQPDPSVMPRHYVYKQDVDERVVKVLRQLERNEGIWSADLPVVEKGTSLFDLVMTSLYHADLQAVEDDVTASRDLQRKQYLNGHRRKGNGHQSSDTSENRFRTSDYETEFSSLATRIDPTKPLCPVIGVRLASVRRGAELVQEIVKTPELRSPRWGASRLALPQGPKKHSNGKGGSANGTRKTKKEKRQ